MPELKGSCLCGNVRYAVDAEPALVAVCHCSDCQKFSGSAFGFLVAVPEAQLEIRGVTKSYAKLGDSGQQIVRRFCPDCGSGISEEAVTQPGLVLLNGGTLDDSSRVTPTIEAYCDREMHWAKLDASMQRFAEMPS
jgi:hypothetical protein